MDKETKEKLKKKLEALRDVYQFQIDAGEDTTVVLQKIGELERLTKD